MKIYETKHDGYVFKIVPDNPDVGAYLYIYKDGEDLYDYLQDSIEHCIGFAYRKFGVPTNAWAEIDKE